MDLNDPLRLPWTFPGLELTVIACALLTLRHAIRHGRLFWWISIFCYGLTMELVSYHAFDNYAHGRFTVMFYGQKLPLYITGIYPLLIYTSLAATVRLGISRAAEPFVVGAAAILLDLPWDLMASVAGWWSWSPTDPNLKVRWLDVPVTNYYWHVAFDGGLAFLVRLADPYARNLRRQLALAPLVGVATIVLGILAFVPFHLLKRAGVPDGTIVATLLAVCAALLVGARSRPERRPAERDRSLLSVPVLFHSFLLLVLATHHTGGLRGALVVAAVLLTLAFHLRASVSDRGSGAGGR
jgi:hypothetical protein